MENKRNILIGTLVVVIGTLLLLNNFDLISEPIKYYLLSWKTLLVVIGIALIASRRNLIGGIFVSSLGIIFWLPEIFNHQFQLGHVFLPAMLVVVGIVLLIKAAGFQRKRNPELEFDQYEELETTDSTTKETN
jgi:predicted membrane protein